MLDVFCVGGMCGNVLNRTGAHPGTRRRFLGPGEAAEAWGTSVPQRSDSGPGQSSAASCCVHPPRRVALTWKSGPARGGEGGCLACGESGLESQQLERDSLSGQLGLNGTR